MNIICNYINIHKFAATGRAVVEFCKSNYHTDYINNKDKVVLYK